MRSSRCCLSASEDPRIDCPMNPLLERLQPYPFERLAQLVSGVEAPSQRPPIQLSIGEPRHPTPAFILEALVAALGDLNRYPTTRGTPELRASIASWLTARFKLPEASIDPDRHILPCCGTREALFALAQAVVNPRRDAKVLMPNPFYQIYEGAAILAGATPYFLNCTRENGYLPDFDAVPPSVWNQCQILYLCSPQNPSGAVLPGEVFARLIELSDYYDFVLASDECYSELYRDEASPPQGLLEVAATTGNTEFSRMVVFHSLSKRSNAPGLRSGFIAGDAKLLERFLLYRTYHGAALSIPIQKASAIAYQDEAHVALNRALYREKFDACARILEDILSFTVPDAGFYLWPEVPGSDEAFAKALFEATNVSVLPGSYLSREALGHNPGYGHIRMALVAPLEECMEAAHRIRDFVLTHHPKRG